MQILLVAGFNIVPFTSKHTATNITSANERLLSTTLVPSIDLCALALSLSSRPFPGDAAQGITTNDSGNRDSSNRGGTSTATKNKRKTRDKERFYTTTPTISMLLAITQKVAKYIKSSLSNCLNT